MPIPYLKPHEVAIPQLQKRLALTDVMACLNAPALGHAIECQRFLIFTKQLLGEMSIPPRGKGKKDGSLHQVKPVDLLAGTLEALPLHHGFDTGLWGGNAAHAPAPPQQAIPLSAPRFAYRTRRLHRDARDSRANR